MKPKSDTSKILFLEQYYTQADLAEVIGTSARYLRLIKEGKRSGASFKEGIDSLYDQTRRAREKPVKRRRPPRRRVSVAYVSMKDVLNVLFNIFEPRTFKAPKAEYQHRKSLYLTHDRAWPARARYNTWDAFFIVWGQIPEGDPRFKKYQRFRASVEEEEVEEDEIQDIELDAKPDSPAAYMAAFQALTGREASVVSHLSVESFIQTIEEFAGDSEMSGLCNFWITRVNTEDLTPQEAWPLMLSIAQDSVDSVNEQSDDINYVMAGVYGFYGWNS